MASVSSVSATFTASIKSVGTAVVMSGVGFYLHRRNFINKEGKRALALMSQQVTFPLYFFTKIIYCNQDWSDKPCPDVTSTLHNTWMLLLWPIYMVSMGLLVGKLVVQLTGTPKHQVPSVLAAIAFANNTALPITLLAVVHANFPSTSDLGRIDPTLFLSVYLVVYPILQWSLGGWILAPGEDDNINDNNTKKDELSTIAKSGRSIGDSIRLIIQDFPHTRYRNVVNNKEMVLARKNRTHGLTSNDEGCYMTELDLEKLGDDWEKALIPAKYDDDLLPLVAEEGSTSSRGSNNDNLLLMDEDPSEEFKALKKTSSFKLFQGDTPLAETQQLKQACGEQVLGLGVGGNYNSIVSQVPPMIPEQNTTPDKQNNSRGITKSQHTLASYYETETLWGTIRNILDRTLFQPPVVGALLGIFCAVTPARGIFVDLVNRHSAAPLQWLFDGLYKVGSIAVPDNMLILGCNLSASYGTYIASRKGDIGSATKGNKKRNHLKLSMKTMIGIVIGKMLVMPFIGISTTYLLQYYVLNIPDEIAGAFYLVLMIVFLTPTANNVMIMIELADCEREVLEGVANVIAMQYAVAPIVLSFTMTVAIGVASEWS